MISSGNDTDAGLRNIIDQRFAPVLDQGKAKVVSLSEAIGDNVQEGMRIHILGLHYRSHAAIYELFSQFHDRRPGFTIIAGAIHGPVMALFHTGMVAKAITAFMGEAYPTMGPIRFIIESLSRIWSFLKTGAF